MVFDYLIKNGIIITGEPKDYPFIGTIGVKGSTISYVGDERKDLEAFEIVDATDYIVMPGLINGHCHGDMTLVRGLADNLSLHEQNEILTPYNFLYNFLTDKDRYDSRQLTYIEAIKSGTTFINENMYWGLGLASVEAMYATGIKGALTEDCRQNFMKPELLIDDLYLKDFAECCRAKGLIPIIGSVSEEDFSADLLYEIYSKAKRYNMLITQHLSETQIRKQMILDRYGKTPIQFLADNKLLSSELIGSHSVHVNKNEILEMAKNDVKVVNTPLCEMKIGDGIAPVSEFVSNGIKVGLGTDGALWNNSNDIFREMKAIVLINSVTHGVRSITASQALCMATLDGAAVFGLENEIGSLKMGKRADIILIDTMTAHLRPLRTGMHSNVISTIVYSATGQDVKTVMINGKIVMKDRVLLTINEREIIARVDKASQRITEQIPKALFSKLQA